MSRITVLGGTGYAGGHIVRAAAARGHDVTSISRALPADQVAGVRYVTGSVLDDAVLASAVADAEVVISALAPRGELVGRVRPVLATLAGLAGDAGVRLGVIGGAGSLLVAPGGPRLADTASFPEAFKEEAAEMSAVLDDLRAREDDLDWFYVSPAAGFGSYAPGEATGTYRLGDDVLLADADGTSAISGADLADAVVTEIETPAHHRRRFTVAY
ncbi:hypothetical protein EDD28_2303 [Salana multivorans]|uniref:NAD(P)-binding domain-containing protein n=1 Tax=Salana multivorans TaxID=120377 RepID=A0A3N2DDG3_9MICO|nr:NAD(P)H-binding protein [Salana multivorans]ROR97698.1 hypothetical protein EDD28_2303 [Salana multivorans]